MKIAVFGSGAIGGYFGGRLAQAGQDVTFIARGKHLEAILGHGLQLKSINGDFSVHPARATDNPQDIGVVDVVLCCVKAWQVSDAAEAMRPLIATHTVVIPLLNGVEAHTELAAKLGDQHVLPGLCRLISMIEAPGIIRHSGAAPYMAFGEMDGRLSRRAKEIASRLNAANGMSVEASQHIFADVWKKFMLIAPWGGVGAVTRVPIGIVRALPESRDMLVDAIHEVFDVGLANGVEIENDALSSTIAFIDKLPPDGTASMQRDIMDGRPSELSWQTGAVVRFGSQIGVSTPTNTFIYHSLLPLERIARGEIS
jgi:2-dehydropantoate 2-reductase